MQRLSVARQLAPLFSGAGDRTRWVVLGEGERDVRAAVAAGREVPYTYLLWALVYCCLYSFVAMLLALILFEDRDLA